MKMYMSLIVWSYLISIACCCCPSGWIRHDTSCYLIETSPLVSWHDAEGHCQNVNGHLVKPETASENNFLRQTLRKFFENSTAKFEFWIGANDLTIDNEWIWEGSGQKVTYFDWGPDEPNGRRQENCLSYYRPKDFGWNDRNCLETEAFICEKEDDYEPLWVGR